MARLHKDGICVKLLALLGELVGDDSASSAELELLLDRDRKMVCYAARVLRGRGLVETVAASYRERFHRLTEAGRAFVAEERIGLEVLHG